MRIEAIELRRVELPLVSDFRTSHGTQQGRDVLLVRVVGPGSEGWGECVAGAAPSYTSEYTDAAQHVIRHHLAPRLLGVDITATGSDADGPTSADVHDAMAPIVGHPMAKAALEVAVLDAELRLTGRSLADHLGAVRREVDSGVAVGITATEGELLDVVDGYLAEGYRRIKLKIEPGRDVDRVRAVREHVGDDVALQVDANEAYALADAERLAALDPFGLLLVEQPLPRHDLLGHAELGRRLRTPLCLDESITSSGDAAAALTLGACRIVNIKPGRVGGLREAVRIHDLCVARNVPAWCGGMLETGIGRAVNVALAALPGFTLPGDLSASARYYADDITDPFVLHDGRLAVPTGPGIGVTPLPDVLTALTTSTELLTP